MHGPTTHPSSQPVLGGPQARPVLGEGRRKISRAARRRVHARERRVRRNRVPLPYQPVYW